MKYRFESVSARDNQLFLQGFFIGSLPQSKGEYALYDNNKKEVAFHLDEIVRNDVGDRFFGKVVENTYGFSISFAYHLGETFHLVLTIDDKCINIKINDAFIHRINAWNQFKNNAGVQNLVFQIRNFGKGKITYSKWYSSHKTSESELERQRHVSWSIEAPKFSLVIPLYKTPEKYLKELIQTLIKQTYTKFEVIFADGSNDNHLEEIIHHFHDERLVYMYLKHNGGISENTNAAMDKASGDFIVLCDHDDLLTEDALYEFAKVITENDKCDCVYSDEDKIDNNGVLFQPHFKPDYNVDLLSNNNYICHLFAVRKELVDKYGQLNPLYDGAQDHDFILRMTENSRVVCHVAKVLYHWRSHSESTASNADAKLYAFTAGQNVVKEHYQRVCPQYSVEKVENGISYGIYHTFFRVNESSLISIIIPNKDHSDDLNIAIKSLEEKNTWKNIEIIVVENNSTEEKTFAYYQDITKKYTNVRVLNYIGEFNYSAINNFGVKEAKGEYVFFLNNDTELVEPDSLKEMVSYLQREDVGIVGCRLLYPDQTIQHAGVVIGIGVADHAFKGQLSDNGTTYFNRAMTVQDCSAVTAAAMMTKKSVFDSVNGFDEQLAVAFNDIDYCLRVRQKNLLVVYNPYACFYHYESKSRGKDDNEIKRARYMAEVELFNTRWKEYMDHGDPYYNPNLTISATDYSLRG